MVLYAVIVEPEAPAAVIAIFSLDLFWTKPENFAARPDTVSVTATADMVGTTEAGTLAMNETVLVPINVLPL